MIDYKAVRTLLPHSTCKSLIYLFTFHHSSSSSTAPYALCFQQIQIDHIYINLFVHLFTEVEDEPVRDDMRIRLSGRR